MLNVSGLTAGYGGSMILRGIKLEVKPGDIVCLMGRNGVGKTTLMKAIMGLIRSKEGAIAFEGQDLTARPPELRARAGIGYVPQGRDIFPQLTAEENLLLGLTANTSKSRRIPDAVFEFFPALRGLLGRKGGDLSGGQQQQLSIARAMVSEPRLLLLDEPMEGIQPSVVQEIEHFIASVKSSRSMAILLVEQSLEFACSIADSYYIMDKGQFVDSGTSDQLSAEQVRSHIVI